jgi:hypothetical protein
MLLQVPVVLHWVSQISFLDMGLVPPQPIPIPVVAVVVGNVVVVVEILMVVEEVGTVIYTQATLFTILQLMVPMRGMDT